MTEKTRTALQSQANTDLADNTTGDITPADVRGMVSDILDSMQIYVTDGSIIRDDGYLQVSSVDTLPTGSPSGILTMHAGSLKYHDGTAWNTLATGGE